MSGETSSDAELLPTTIKDDLAVRPSVRPTVRPTDRPSRVVSFRFFVRPTERQKGVVLLNLRPLEQNGGRLSLPEYPLNYCATLSVAPYI